MPTSPTTHPNPLLCRPVRVYTPSLAEGLASMEGWDARDGLAQDEGVDLG